MEVGRQGRGSRRLERTVRNSVGFRVVLPGASGEPSRHAERCVPISATRPVLALLMAACRSACVQAEHSASAEVPTSSRVARSCDCILSAILSASSRASLKRCVPFDAVCMLPEAEQYHRRAARRFREGGAHESKDPRGKQYKLQKEQATGAVFSDERAGGVPAGASSRSARWAPVWFRRGA